MKKTILLLAIAAAVFSGCNALQDKQQSIDSYNNGLVEFSKISKLITNEPLSDHISYNVDSIAKTIKPDDPYKTKMLKSNEMLFTIANEVAYTWVNCSVEKYLNSDDSIVSLNGNDGKNPEIFRNAIVQSLIGTRSMLEYCFDKENVEYKDLTDLSFSVLNAFNTFFFCYYFVTDNNEYLTFFTKNSERLESLHNYADSLYMCNKFSDEQAFEMASTLESTAFLITMNVLSFNMLWSNNAQKTQQYADYFNEYSQKSVSAIFSDKNKFSERQYSKFISKSTDYKIEIMKTIIESLDKNNKKN